MRSFLTKLCVLAAVEIFVIIYYDSPFIINAVIVVVVVIIIIIIIIIIIACFAVITRASPYFFTALVLANGIKEVSLLIVTSDLSTFPW